LDTRWDWATFGVSLIWSSKTEAVRSITASLFFFFQTATASRVINILLVYTRGKYPALMLRWQLSGRAHQERNNKQKDIKTIQSNQKAARRCISSALACCCAAAFSEIDL
jgi:hypothetical protein